MAPLHAQGSAWEFYRGVNLNGPAAVIDGNRWEADATAKNFVCKDQRFENQNVPLRPATDDVRARMIRSSRWRPDGNGAITLTSLPEGSYRVYLYNWEDTEPQKFSVSFEGRTVLSNYDSGPAGTWKKLGPWDVAVADGSLEITCRGGHANLSGLEVWRRADSDVVAEASVSARTRSGLVALYTFDAGSGETVRDRSGVGRPLDLKIDDPTAVAWQSGHLVVRSATRIQSSAPATKIIDAVMRFGAITIEAWIRPANDRQGGPARIVSLSADPNQRNFTLGQEAGAFDVRLRTTKTDGNGMPSTPTPQGTARSGLAHVVYSRDPGGTARVYINGQQQAARELPGGFSNWNESLPLILANEVTGDRPWLGALYLVAIYGRALNAAEVEQNFHAGAAAATAAALAQNQHVKLFETKIAPLLARNCLECHDSAAQKGGLDLSRKSAALAGGENGACLVPGNATESLLWQLVDSGDMPAEGEPLSAEEKTLLRQWIDAGATWSLDLIDPAVYAHDDDDGAGRIWVQRLTVPEYIETVRSAVGVDISKEAGEILPPDLRADGFSNTAYNLNVDLKHVDAYARLAEIIVGRMDVLEFAARFSKSRRLSTDDTMRQFVAGVGKWLLRGPLEEREITNYSGIATTVASAGGDYKEAVSYIIEAMLQSPRFIYRIESQRGDGTAWPVTAHELASRMSYILWGAPPDAELMRAADAGELHDRRHVESQVRRMLEDPRAIARSVQFIVEWLNLDRLDNLRPDPKKFPKWDPALAADMRAETIEFFKEVVWKQNRPLSDLLNAQFTYATLRLAEHYGLEPNLSSPHAPREATPDTGQQALSRYDISSVPARGGLLTQGSVLTVGGDDASMVTRGLFVLHDLLRGTVKDPPPGVDTTPVPSKPGLSQRSVSEQRIANVSCGGCHGKFEPLAFALEPFGGLGAFREEDDYGNKLRDDGEILIPGAAQPVTYQTSADLMDLLAGSDRVRETITWKLTQFALGRPLGAADARTIQEIHETAQKAGGNYAGLITAVVTSDLVMMTRTQKDR